MQVKLFGLMMTGKCKCGCGRLISKPDARGRERKYIHGHNPVKSRFKKNHTISRKHGKSNTVEHKTWCEMKRRCYNPNRHNYKYYGGRGIKVAEEWLGSFDNFLQDMGLKPSPHHSIDRIDNNDDYRPGNCRWATQREQVLNRRRTGNAV